MQQRYIVTGRHKVCGRLLTVISFLDPAKEAKVGEKSMDLRAVESWLSPSQAGAMLGTSGQWVTQLARREEVDAIRTSLGWLINPADVERLANERLEKAEKKVSAMKSARTAGVAGARARRAGRRRTSIGGGASG